jgi:hypothetical protein
MSEERPEPRLIREEEVYDREDVERGLLRRPNPPDPRPELPVEEQHEQWARLASLPPRKKRPVLDWIAGRLERRGSE